MAAGALPLSADEIAWARARVAEGLEVDDLAVDIGCHAHALRSALGACKGAWTPEEDDALHRLAGSGCSARQIGVIIDRPRHSVLKRARRWGVALTARGGRRVSA